MGCVLLEPDRIRMHTHRLSCVSPACQHCAPHRAGFPWKNPAVESFTAASATSYRTSSSSSRESRRPRATTAMRRWLA
jgi:hypothetical protein